MICMKSEYKLIYLTGIIKYSRRLQKNSGHDGAAVPHVIFSSKHVDLFIYFLNACCLDSSFLMYPSATHLRWGEERKQEKESEIQNENLEEILAAAMWWSWGLNIYFSNKITKCHFPIVWAQPYIADKTEPCQTTHPNRENETHERFNVRLVVLSKISYAFFF